ncbi:MAG: hypothetical protein ABI920_15750 [Casimicrobiaceae bacterium]
MTSLDIPFGKLAALGFSVQRSGVRFVREDGLCRAGEVVAYCNIALVPDGRAHTPFDPFFSESRDFQVAFALRTTGVFRANRAVALGGFLDHLTLFQTWHPDETVGTLDPTAPTQDLPGGDCRLLFLAGRRSTELAEVRAGLHTGWHDRSRAWWGDAREAPDTLVCLGICEQMGVVRGDRFAYLELFAQAQGPAHVVYFADDVLVPSARIVLDQAVRTARERAAIADDLRRSFGTGSSVPSPGDWIFAGALLAALNRSPFSDPYDTLTRAGLRRGSPVGAVMLSLNAESRMLLRHRQLGYHVNCHRFRILESGNATRAWLQANFDPVDRSPGEILADYRALVDAVRARSHVEFLILNCMSTSGLENPYHYDAFEQPMRNTVPSIRSKELNLMLHDLAREKDVAIIDVDRMAAGLGAGVHLPDGVHASGTLQREIRGELLRVLTGRGLRGFAPADQTTT